MIPTAQVFTKRPHYDPKSPGLLGPLPSSGYCFHDERLDVDTLTWYDFDAPLMSGDVVALFYESEHGLKAIGKWLQYTPDGHWWGVSYATRDEDSLTAVRLDHPAFRFGGVAAMVAKLETPRATSREPESDAANRTPHAKRFFECAGASVIAHWKEHGFPPRARWDFSTPPENIAVIRKVWGTIASANPPRRFPFTLAATCAP
jgi:hypothetical protein